MAEAMDVSPSYLCKIEKGLQDPTADFINKASNFLNIPNPKLFPEKIKKSEVHKLNSQNKLWTVRKERGIKQYELAEMLNVSPSYLSKVEKGIQHPTEKFRKQCAKVLKVKEKVLFS